MIYAKAAQIVESLWKSSPQRYILYAELLISEKNISKRTLLLKVIYAINSINRASIVPKD